MVSSSSVTVVVDGYRGRQDDGSGPLANALVDHPAIWNSWAGPDDSLCDRVERLLEWNTARGDRSTPVHLVASSMGCQVAVRIAEELEVIDEFILIAPDPKARPCDRDGAEDANGIVSAFREAQELWNGAAVPAQPFSEALVALAARTRLVRVVYCRSDGVAEWDGNVETLIAELAAVKGIRLIEAMDHQTVTASGLTVDLSAGGTTDVHERMWSATHIHGRHTFR